MSDFVLIDGDLVMFNPNFGPAIVKVQPGVLKASGGYNPHYAEHGKLKAEKGDEPLRQGVNGRAVCIEGDERNVLVPGCIYTTPMYPIPGVGTLKIQSLPSDCRAQQDSLSGKRVLLKGRSFMAVFEVQTAAKMPLPGPGAPLPDPTPQYTRTGHFVTTNQTQKAT